MIGTWLAWKLTRFGIWMYELQPFGLLDAEDKANLRKLWEMHDKFEGALNESNQRT